uniref:Uncharacterized protein n=1 Tax=Salarias fasciatus TaxID=181472 RepID=A0A672H4N6_SALFA
MKRIIKDLGIETESLLLLLIPVAGLRHSAAAVERTFRSCGTPPAATRTQSPPSGVVITLTQRWMLTRLQLERRKQSSCMLQLRSICALCCTLKIRIR